LKDANATQLVRFAKVVAAEYLHLDKTKRGGVELVS